MNASTVIIRMEFKNIEKQLQKREGKKGKEGFSKNKILNLNFHKSCLFNIIVKKTRKKRRKKKKKEEKKKEEKKRKKKEK